jgi:hypothetical protein
VRRSVERLAAVPRGRLVGIADRQQQLALRRELPDGVLAVIGEPVRSIGPDRDAVRPADDAVAPRPDERAVDGVVAAIEDDDVCRRRPATATLVASRNDQPSGSRPQAGTGR